MNASSSVEVGQLLGAQKLIPITVTEESEFFDIGKLFNFSMFKPRANLSELNILFRQLSSLVGAGVPLLEALVSVEDLITNDKLKRVVRELEEAIGGGMVFSQALGKFPTVFSQLVVAMVGAGEATGTLEAVLEKVTMYYEKEIVMRQRISAALRYPILVVSAIGIAFVVVITFVIPKFSTVFTSMKAELPLPTRFLLALNYVFINFGWLLLILLFVGINALRMYINTEKGRLNWDKFLLGLPVFGVLINKVSLARFFRMLATMVSSGIPIVTGLEITASTADNAVIANTIFKIRDRVTAGTGLSAPMGEDPVFPPTAVQMVAVGERSGTLDKMLNKCADYFESETDYMVGNLMSLLEPIIIFALGMMVLTLALGIFLPMWDMMNLYVR